MTLYGVRVLESCTNNSIKFRPNIAVDVDHEQKMKNVGVKHSEI